MIKVLQINLNRCRAAHALLERTSGERRIDVCLLSEPNKAIARGKPGWITDAEGDTAIYTGGKAQAIRERGKGNGFTWVHVHGVGVFYSCYFSPNKELGEFEDFLEGLANSLRERGGESDLDNRRLQL